MINTFIALFLFTLPGALTVLLIRKKTDLPELLACAYGLGLGICSYGMFLLSAVGLPLNRNSVVTAIILLILALSILLWKKRGFSLNQLEHSRTHWRLFHWSTPINGLLILLIACLLITGLTGAAYWPVYEWDALMMHHFKAKVFDHYGTIRPENFELPNAFYPLLIPLTHTWLIQWNVPIEKIIYPLLLLSLILTLIHFFKAYGAIPVALLAGSLIAGTPLIWEHSQIIYLNLPATVYLSMGIFYFYEWILQGRRSSFVLANLFGVFACWTRSEALLLTAIIWGFSLILCLARKRIGEWFLICMPAVVLSMVWSIYLGLANHLKGVGGASEVTDLSKLMDAERWNLVYDAVLSHIESHSVFGGFWFLSLPILALALIRWSYFNVIQILMVLSMFLVIVLTVSIGSYTPATMDLFLGSGLMRLFMYLIPVVTFLLASQWLPRRHLTWQAFRQGGCIVQMEESMADSNQKAHAADTPEVSSEKTP